jgi:serine kinase of HPr protein (carbohydrate metabolism regulator)
MNIHATAIAIEGMGLLIEGASGSGKTSLALAAIEKLQGNNRFAALVADDQCLLEVANGRLITTCPPSLLGRAEMRGHGIVKQKSLDAVIIDAVIHLVDQTGLERMPKPETTHLNGIELPVYQLPARQIAVSLPILLQIVESRRF